MSNVDNVKNANNLNMQEYAKLLEDIPSQLEVVESVINLNLDLLEKLKTNGSHDEDILTLYELNRVKNNYINLNLDSLLKIQGIVDKLYKLQDMEVQNGN